MSIVRAGAADILSVYVGKGGGISAARKIAAVAEAAGIVCTVGSNLELGVASAAMIHLAMATPTIAAEEFPCDILTPFFYETDLLAESLPDALGKLLPADLQGTPRLEYRGSPGTWTVTIPRRQEDHPQTGVLWSETQIWCGPTQQVSGRTAILLGPQEIEHIELDIPGGIELQGVLLDGEFIPHTSREQRLRIPLTFPQSGHAITLYWTLTTGSFSGFYNQATFNWPRVSGKSAGEEYVTVTPPVGFRLHASQGKSVERLQVQLSELQAILGMMQQRAAGGPAPQDAQWLYLHRQAASLIKRLQPEPLLSTETGALSKQFSELRTQFAPWEQSNLSAETGAVPGGLPPAVLRSFSNLEGNLAGPHSLLLQLPKDDALTSPLRVSVIHESLSRVAGGVGLAVVVLLSVWPLLRWKFPEWLAEQPAVAWLLLGLIWWPCLTPSWLGLVWLGLAVFYAARHILRTATPPTDASDGHDLSQAALT